MLAVEHGKSRHLRPAAWMRASSAAIQAASASSCPSFGMRIFSPSLRVALRDFCGKSALTVFLRDDLRGDAEMFGVER